MTPTTSPTMPGRFPTADPNQFRGIRDEYRARPSIFSELKLPEYGRAMNSLFQTQRYDPVTAGGIANVMKHGSANLDEAFEKSGLTEIAGDAGAFVGKHIPFTDGRFEDLGRQVGAQIPRGVADFAPMLGAGLLTAGGVATGPAGWAALAATGGMVGANVYEKTDDPTQALVMGGLSAATPLMGRAGAAVATRVSPFKTGFGARLAAYTGAEAGMMAGFTAADVKFEGTEILTNPEYWVGQAIGNLPFAIADAPSLVTGKSMFSGMQQPDQNDVLAERAQIEAARNDETEFNDDVETAREGGGDDLDEFLVSDQEIQEANVGLISSSISSLMKEQKHIEEQLLEVVNPKKRAELKTLLEDRYKAALDQMVATRDEVNQGTVMGESADEFVTRVKKETGVTDFFSEVDEKTDSDYARVKSDYETQLRERFESVEEIKEFYELVGGQKIAGTHEDSKFEKLVGADIPKNASEFKSEVESLGLPAPLGLRTRRARKAKQALERRVEDIHDYMDSYEEDALMRDEAELDPYDDDAVARDLEEGVNEYNMTLDEAAEMSDHRRKSETAEALDDEPDFDYLPYEVIENQDGSVTHQISDTVGASGARQEFRRYQELFSSPKLKSPIAKKVTEAVFMELYKQNPKLAIERLNGYKNQAQKQLRDLNLNERMATPEEQQIIDHVKKASSLYPVENYSRSRVEAKDMQASRFGAVYDKKSRSVVLSPHRLAQMWREKRWENPPAQDDGSKAKPIPADEFATIEEWTEFVIQHELAHYGNAKKASETHGQYETRINDMALAAMTKRTGDVRLAPLHQARQYADDRLGKRDKAKTFANKRNRGEDFAKLGYRILKDSPVFSRADKTRSKEKPYGTPTIRHAVETVHSLRDQAKKIRQKAGDVRKKRLQKEATELQMSIVKKLIQALHTHPHLEANIKRELSALGAVQQNTKSLKLDETNNTVGAKVMKVAGSAQLPPGTVLRPVAGEWVVKDMFDAKKRHVGAKVQGEVDPDSPVNRALVEDLEETSAKNALRRHLKKQDNLAAAADDPKRGGFWALEGEKDKVRPIRKAFATFSRFLNTESTYAGNDYSEINNLAQQGFDEIADLRRDVIDKSEEIAELHGERAAFEYGQAATKMIDYMEGVYREYSKRTRARKPITERGHLVEQEMPPDGRHPALMVSQGEHHVRNLFMRMGMDDPGKMPQPSSTTKFSQYMAYAKRLTQAIEKQSGVKLPEIEYAFNVKDRESGKLMKGNIFGPLLGMLYNNDAMVFRKGRFGRMGLKDKAIPGRMIGYTTHKTGAETLRTIEETLTEAGVDPEIINGVITIYQNMFNDIRNFQAKQAAAARGIEESVKREQKRAELSKKEFDEFEEEKTLADAENEVLTQEARELFESEQVTEHVPIEEATFPRLSNYSDEDLRTWGKSNPKLAELATNRVDRVFNEERDDLSPGAVEESNIAELRDKILTEIGASALIDNERSIAYQSRIIELRLLEILGYNPKATSFDAINNNLREARLAKQIPDEVFEAADPMKAYAEITNWREKGEAPAAAGLGSDIEPDAGVDDVGLDEYGRSLTERLGLAMEESVFRSAAYRVWPATGLRGEIEERTKKSLRILANRMMMKAEDGELSLEYVQDQVERLWAKMEPELQSKFSEFSASEEGEIAINDMREFLGDVATTLLGDMQRASEVSASRGPEPESVGFGEVGGLDKVDVEEGSDQAWVQAEERLQGEVEELRSEIEMEVDEDDMVASEESQMAWAEGHSEVMKVWSQAMDKMGVTRDKQMEMAGLVEPLRAMFNLGPIEFGNMVMRVAKGEKVDPRFDEMLGRTVEHGDKVLVALRGKMQEGMTDVESARLANFVLVHELSHATEMMLAKGRGTKELAAAHEDFVKWSEEASVEEMQLATKLLAEHAGVDDVWSEAEKLAQMTPDEVRANLQALWAYSSARSAFNEELPARVLQDTEMLMMQPVGVAKWFGRLNSWMSRILSSIGVMQKQVDPLSGAKEGLDKLNRVMGEMNRSVRQVEDTVAEMSQLGQMGDGSDWYLGDVDFNEHDGGKMFGGKEKPKKKKGRQYGKSNKHMGGLPRSGDVSKPRFAARVASEFFEKMEVLAARVPELAGAFASVLDHTSGVSSSSIRAMAPLFGGVDASNGQLVNDKVALDKYQRLATNEKTRGVFGKLVVEMQRKGEIIDPRDLVNGKLAEEFKKLPKEEQDLIVELLPKFRESIKEAHKVVDESLQEEATNLVANYLVKKLSAENYRHDEIMEMASDLVNAQALELDAATQGGDAAAAYQMKLQMQAKPQTKLLASGDVETYQRALILTEKLVKQRIELKEKFDSQPYFLSVGDFGSELKWNAGDLHAGVSRQWSEIIGSLDRQREQFIDDLGDLSDADKQLMKSRFDTTAELERLTQQQRVAAKNAGIRGDEERIADSDLVEAHRAYVNLVVGISHTRVMNSKLAFEMSRPDLKGKWRYEADQFNQMVTNYKNPDTGVSRALTEGVFVYTMGLNISSHVLETFQPAFSMLPELVRHANSPATAGRIFLDSMKDVGAFTTKRLMNRSKDNETWKDVVSGDEGETVKLLMDQAAADKMISLGFVSDVIGDGDDGMSLRARKEALGSMGMRDAAVEASKMPWQALVTHSRNLYGWFTQMNARNSVLMGWRLAKERFPDEPDRVPNPNKPGSEMLNPKLYAEAKRFSATTTFSTGRAGRPTAPFTPKDPISRTAAVGAQALQTYTQGMLGLINAYGQHGLRGEHYGLSGLESKKSRQALATMLGVQVLGAGALGLPFVGALMASIEKLTDHEPNKWLRENLAKLFREDEAEGGVLTEMALRGGINALLSKTGFTPDMGSRFALGGVIGTDAYNGYSAEALFGPSLAIVGDIIAGGGKMANGNFKQGFQEMVPVFAKRPFSMWAGGGEIRDWEGGKLIEAGLGEKAAYMAGFNPQRVRQLRDTERILRRHRDVGRSKDKKFHDKLATLLEKDPSAVRAKLIEKEQESDGTYSAQAGARKIADRVIKRHYPHDPRRDAALATSQSEEGLLRATNLAAITPSEAAIQQTRFGIMNQLGFASEQGPDLQLARLMDQIQKQRPWTTRAMAKLEAQRMMTNQKQSVF